MAILTREQILTHEMSEGHARLWRFIDAVNKGKTPKKEDLTALGESFQLILDGDNPKKALGLSGKQSEGRRPRDNSTLFEREIAPVILVEKLRQDGCSVEEAMAIVTKEMCEKGLLKTNKIFDEEDFIHDSLKRYRKKHLKRALERIQLLKSLYRFSEDTEKAKERLNKMGIDYEDPAFWPWSKMPWGQFLELIDYLESLRDEERGALIKSFSDLR